MAQLTLYEKLRHPPEYVTASLIAALVPYLFGLDTGSIGPITTMTQFNILPHLSSTVHGLIVSSILLPAATASFFAGRLSDLLGRPKGMAIGTGIFGIGAALEAGSVHIAMLILARILAGIGEGLYLSQVVVYICEIAPPRERGALASMHQLVITIGICSGYFICYGSVNISSSLAWRLPFAFQALSAFSLSASCLYFLPDSPRWLNLVGRPKDADSAWDKLGVSHAEREKAQQQNIDVVIEETAPSSFPPPEKESKKNILLAIFGRKVWKRTMLGVFLMGFQQLSGIDGVLYYAPVLFQQAGLSGSKASFLASGISAIVMLVVTIPATIYSDKWGRRTSTILGGIGIATTMLVIGSLYASGSVHGSSGAARWVVIVMVYLFTIIFSITWAVTLKIYCSEIQTPKTRAAASSLGFTSNWIINFVVALTTPIFLSKSTFGAYFLFGFATLFTVVVCILFMPETRGRSLEEIDEAFETDSDSASKLLMRLRGLASRLQRHRLQPSPPSSEIELTRSSYRTMEDALVR